ncbi:unnamed protein product [Protopolystoma xenopodis]|uniref:Uncharacterized protein n=1 Tax=Protopolystoma xenopodis TaxID=117903 RepID=A0A3S5AE16_9PLAT|nr:unnamed protein product [Protopolystoma xenopodis]
MNVIKRTKAQPVFSRNNEGLSQPERRIKAKLLQCSANQSSSGEIDLRISSACTYRPTKVFITFYHESINHKQQIHENPSGIFSEPVSQANLATITNPSIMQEASHVSITSTHTSDRGGNEVAVSAVEFSPPIQSDYSSRSGRPQALGVQSHCLAPPNFCQPNSSEGQSLFSNSSIRPIEFFPKLPQSLVAHSDSCSTR